MSDDGLFLTANHVITGVPPNSRLLYCGSVPHKILNQPVEIKEVYSDKVKDIYIGQVDKSIGLPKLELSKEKVKIGQSVCLCGYPLAQIFLNPDKSINVINVRKYWQPTHVIDYYRFNEPDGRIYESFITQHTSLNGMSGGPVFGTDGLVYGIDVATFTRKIDHKNNPMTVHNGVAIEILYISEILKKHNIA
ncbi:MAG: hypothetical protein A2252_06280 [Elusimicrobia bacterium RIFOXYA2_FULL_39_19]|nr:MAG: hypothetical protein A2252_06280 [Elusimicrobia bacterium RIFOXYA2_FULL_39_19]